MIQLRAEQLQAFSADARRRFEDCMVAHLNKLFPGQCGPQRERRTRLAIAYGIERAANHGLTTERDVCIFIELMYTFGQDFDADMKLPWAARILRDPQCHPSLRIERAWEVSRMWLHEARGLDGAGLEPVRPARRS